jgi:protein TonB
MTSDAQPPAVPPPAAPASRAADIAALFWLARWLGIPFVIVIGLYYAEPLLRGGPAAEFVPSITQQEVHPYPFEEGAEGPSLAPIDVPRPTPLPYPAFPGTAPPAPAAVEIVANPISQPTPRYPKRALEREKEGIVRVRLTIAPDGSVSEATVIGAEPPGWFENAALDAVKQWRYQPPGRPLVTEAVIEFKLD